MRRLAVLMRHLEKQQVGQLFEVVAITDAIVAQRVTEGPDFRDDGRGGHFNFLCCAQTQFHML
jgi:hypothetical protein